MNSQIRRQLTLFIDRKDSVEIENIRKTFNPLQFGLIESHVTPCREDEIENLPAVSTRKKKDFLAMMNNFIT